MAQKRAPWRQDLVWRIEALGYDLFGAVFALMPLDVASALGGALLRLLGPLTGAHKTARRNLMIAFPDMDPAQRRRLLRAQWDNVGRLTAEFQLMHKLTPRSGRIEMVNAERLDRIRESGESVVFVSGHLSNWEVMPMIIVCFGVVCQMTYRAANNPYIDRRIVESRRRYGVELFAPKGGSGSRDILAGLRRGESVALMNDQKFNGGVAAPFFGVTVHTAPGPTRLALRSSGVLQPMSVQRTRGARFRVVVHEPIVLERTGDRTQDIEDGVRRINAFVEDRVRERPHEWFWVHRRWPNEAYAALGPEA
jgi:KDO2-lipid IV(A) lauroyltransferase